MPTALVTGASTGIGYDFAQVLAQNGYDLIIVARNLDRLNDIQKEFTQKYNIQVHVMPGDLSHAEVPQQIYDEVTKKGLAVDVLINNAGFGYSGMYLDQEWDNEHDMIQLNIVSLAHLTRLFLKGMVERKSGRILNVASTAAFQPGPLMAVYYATKGYVLHYSEAIANELKGTGVTVTTLCPGPTETEFQNRAKLEDTRLFKNLGKAKSMDVARYGFNAMMKGKSVAVYGFFNKVLLFSQRFSPRAFNISVVRYLQSNR